MVNQDGETQLNVFLVWGIVAAVATVIAKRKLNLPGKNLLLVFETENVGAKAATLKKSSWEYEAITKMILNLEAWSETRKVRNIIDFPGAARVSRVTRWINRFRINLSPNPLRLALDRRNLARQLARAHAGITCLSSDNLNDWKYFYGTAFTRHILVEHGSLLYRQYLTTKEKSPIYVRWIKELLVSWKFRLNLARDVSPDQILSLVDIDREPTEQPERDAYRRLIAEFFQSYEREYPTEFRELLALKKELSGKRVQIFGPYVEAVPEHVVAVFAQGIEQLRNAGTVVLIKKHPSDPYDGYLQMCKDFGLDGREFEHSLNGMIPLEFLLWFFDGSSYVGSPTVGAMYSRMLLGKKTIVYRSGVRQIDELYENEYGPIMHLM